MNTATANRIDTAHRGTDEASWKKLLAAAPLWSPRQGHLLIVSPHPDNEVLAAGGLIHMWKEQARPVTILSLTDGEAAHPERNGLARLRREELKEALQVLSINPPLVVRLGIPHGSVADHSSRLRGAIVSLSVPDTTIIAPYEHDGHPDHAAAGRICCEMGHALGFPVARYPVWTWHRADPLTMTGVPWRRFPLTEQAQEAKADALTCFASQIFPYKRAAIFPQHIIRYFARPYETFVL